MRPNGFCAAVSFLVLCAVAASVTEAGATECDRDCLRQQVDRLLASFVANDPDVARLADGFRYTENGQALAPGDGLWGTATAIGGYRAHFEDVEAGQAAFMGIVLEHDEPALLSLRVRAAADGVSEAEAIVARQGLGGANVAAALQRLGEPNRLWGQPVPAERRATRAELIRVANYYFEGLENNDGLEHYPFTEDCDRLENGNRTTNNPDIAPPSGYGQGVGNLFELGCREQFETGYFAAVTRVRDLRFPLVDVERGVVFAQVFFDHSGAVRETTLTDGTKVEFGLARPFTWHVGEAFRIEDGKIRFIEAILTEAPYGMQSGWRE